MARTVTTDSIESRTSVAFGYDVWDLFFLMFYIALIYSLRIFVHPKLRIVYIIFSVLVAIFLTTRSTLNKRRKNYESLYFLISKDISTYRPFYSRKDR